MALKKGQAAKYWISRVKEILKQPAILSPRHRRSKSKEVQQLLRQEAKLFITDDDVLYRKNKEQHQVALPHSLKEAVYRKLHINMAHVGADRTLPANTLGKSNLILWLYFGKLRKLLSANDDGT